MNIFKKYNWLFEIISAALLLAMGMVIIFVDEVILYITGVVFVFMGLFRVIPLIKTTNDKLMKWLLFLEILIGIAAGCYLFYMGLEKQTVGKVFGYIVGAVFYLRGFTHFVATSLRGEPNTTINFFTNIILLSLGVFLIFNGDINQQIMSYIIGAVLFICTLFLGIKGSKDYSNYRGNLVSKHQTKKIKKNVEVKEEKKDPVNDELNIDITNIDNNLNIEKNNHVDA